MVVTKYSTGNVVLLLIGIGVALADVWLGVMTEAFGADLVRDMRSGTVIAVLRVSFVLLPASLITAKWPRLGATISWSLAVLCCVSLWASSVLTLFLILAASEGLIATIIARRSERTPPITVIPE